MQISPLQLDAFWSGKVVLEPGVQPIVPSAQVRIETIPTFRRNDADPRTWIVELRVVFGWADGTRIAYEGSVEMTGIQDHQQFFGGKTDANRRGKWPEHPLFIREGICGNAYCARSKRQIRASFRIVHRSEIVAAD
jgi:hypothetical protein